MKKYNSRFALSLLLSLLLATTTFSASNAQTLAVYDSVAISSTPLADIQSLSEGQKIEFASEVEIRGIPENLAKALSVAFQPRIRSLYYDYTDLAQSVGEQLNCVLKFGITACLTANNDSTTAAAGARNWFPISSLHNGSGDAFRHCWWSGLMYLHLGQGPATTIAADHETYNPSPLEEFAMDTYNNMKGRVSGLQSTSDYGSRNICLDWAKNGGLVIIQ